MILVRTRSWGGNYRAKLPSGKFPIKHKKSSIIEVSGVYPWSSLSSIINPRSLPLLVRSDLQLSNRGSAGIK